ncbi:ABC transporter substrate-binding protein, partial [Candidatus Parcubacteria bacterium]|nr:ABC transporter substrate-binding protein [Candidatus Parcubacteria bacterium]
MNKTTRTILWIVIAVVIIAGIWYGTSKKPVITEKEVIKIGVILPLTGTSADAGSYVKNGLLLAQEELNLNTSLKYRYDLVFEDSRYSPMDGVTAIRKFIDIDKYNYIVGAHSSSVTLAMAPIAEENKVLLITPSSQSDEISTAGDYIFRTQINTAQEAKFLSKFIYNQITSKKLAVLVINTAYG